MHSEGLLQHLRSGKRAYGTAILTASPLWPPLVAKTGLDFVFIDSEHIALDRQELSWIAAPTTHLDWRPWFVSQWTPYSHARSWMVAPVVTVAPYVETPEQVKALVGAVKWRPLKGKNLSNF